MTPINVVMKAIYEDGSVATLLWKMSGIVGQRLDEQPLDIIVVRQEGVPFDKIADRVMVDMQAEVMSIRDSLQKYPEYYV